MPDARALTAYLRHSAGRVLSEGFERDVFSITAEQMVDRFYTLHADGRRLLGIRATLEGIGANVRLEMRRAFEHDFPPPDAIPTLDVLRNAGVDEFVGIPFDTSPEGGQRTRACLRTWKTAASPSSH